MLLAELMYCTYPHTHNLNLYVLFFYCVFPIYYIYYLYNSIPILYYHLDINISASFDWSTGDTGYNCFFIWRTHSFILFLASRVSIWLLGSFPSYLFGIKILLFSGIFVIMTIISWTFTRHTSEDICLTSIFYLTGRLSTIRELTWHLGS